MLRTGNNAKHKEKPLNLTKISRHLTDLDKLEARIRATVNPSAVLLAEIERQRKLLMEGKDPNATAQTQPGK